MDTITYALVKVACMVALSAVVSFAVAKIGTWQEIRKYKKKRKKP